MAWVLLSLRKAELQRLHSDYQAEDLRISREERQMSRHFQYEQSVVRNTQQKALRDLRTDYTDKRSSLYEQIKALREEANEDPNDDKTTSTVTTSDGKTTINDLYDELSEEKLEYEKQVEEERQIWEDELAMLEEEANDAETDYENQKVLVETQMEAVAQELNAITQSISQEIQNSTIKLS